MESEKNGVKFLLRARTVGLCATYNRLLAYRVARNTKPVTFTPAEFVCSSEYATQRTAAHRAKHPCYPDPLFYLSLLVKYYLRHESLLHLRIEQFNRYLALLGDDDSEINDATTENTRDEEEDTRYIDANHRHWAPFMEDQPVGKRSRARLRWSARRAPPPALAAGRLKDHQP